MSRCRSIPITVANRYAKVSIDTYCFRYVKFCRPIYIAKTSRYLYNIPYTTLSAPIGLSIYYVLSTPVGLSTSWCIDYRLLVEYRYVL